MIPNFTIGSRTVSAYVIMTVIGIFAAGCYSLRQTDEADRLDFLTVLLWSAVGVLTGGRLLYAATQIGNIIDRIAHWRGIWGLLDCFGGNVFYGGLLGGILAAYIYCRKKKLNYSRFTASAALFIPLFHVFGRIGCFLSGCCYGVECRFGLTYRYSIIESANHVARFPVQLAEALGNLIIFAAINALRKNNSVRASLLHIYLTAYSVLRFALEFFRGDAYRGFFMGLSTSQLISILLFGYGSFALIKARRGRNDSREQQLRY